MGAKTNVGYGQFLDPSPPIGEIEEKEGTGSGREEVSSKYPRKDFEKMKGRGEAVTGVVTSISGNMMRVKLDLDNYDAEVETAKRNLNQEAVGKRFRFIIAAIQGRGSRRKPTINLANPKPI